jgi:hypothetical protein
VTVARRLAALETSLGPTERVLAWLDEAQAFGSLEAYVDSLLDQPPEAFPINRLAREAASAARTEVKRPAEAVDEAVRRALRATIFRFELVIRINVVAHEMIDRETLIHLAFAGQVGVLISDERAERRADPAYLRQLGVCRDMLLQRVDELLAAQEARSIAETRYLDGHTALFPVAADRWAEQVRLSQELAVMTDRIAELDGVPMATAPDPEAGTERATELAADLIEPARSTALDKLDEGRHALTIASAWLRSKRASLAGRVVTSNRDGVDVSNVCSIMPILSTLKPGVGETVDKWQVIHRGRTVRSQSMVKGRC